AVAFAEDYKVLALCKYSFGKVFSGASEPFDRLRAGFGGGWSERLFVGWPESSLCLRTMCFKRLVTKSVTEKTFMCGWDIIYFLFFFKGSISSALECAQSNHSLNSSFKVF